MKLLNEKSVLIVDDEVLLTGCLADILAAFGFKTKTCTTVKLALEEFIKEPTDFVVTDLILPKESGLDLIDSISEFNQQVKFVIMTGSDTDVLLDKTVQHDGRRHVKILAKPFAPQDIVDLLT